MTFHHSTQRPPKDLTAGLEGDQRSAVRLKNRGMQILAKLNMYNS